MNHELVRKWYSRYVEKKMLFRTFSAEYLTNFKQNGFNPTKNPYDSQKTNIIYFCKLLDKLEKDGYNYAYLHWPKSKPTGLIVSKVFIKSLRKKYIDLTPNDFNDLDYYRKRSGGDIPNTVLHVSKDLIKWNYPLSNMDKKVLKELIVWSSKRVRFQNIVVKIKATSKYLEKMHLQRFYGQSYLPSPFGSFENFSKQIKKYGFEVYKPYLKGTEQYYIRFTNRVPASEFELI